MYIMNPYKYEDTENMQNIKVEFAQTLNTTPVLFTENKTNYNVLINQGNQKLNITNGFQETNKKILNFITYMTRPGSLLDTDLGRKQLK